MSSPHAWTVQETLRALTTRAISSAELVQMLLDRIDKHNSTLRAYVTVSPTALDEARRSDALRATGQTLGPLAGVPIAVKDLFDTDWLPTTYGSSHYRNHQPTTTATAVSRLRQAGAIILGKTNLHEYAFGTTGENAHHGTSANPWKRAKITGGSSGGNSAAIVAGLCMAAIGTDTGGSIRIPASLTGHVGLKPTYGLVSKAGVHPLAPSLDHVGPMTKSARDAALLLEVLAGRDALDLSTWPQPIRLYQRREWPKPIRMGVPRQFFFDRCQTQVTQTISSALNRVRSHDIIIDEISIPWMEDVPDAQSTILSSEAYHVHAQLLKSRPAEYGEDVRKRLEDAAGIPAWKYLRARDIQAQFRASLVQLFREVDVIVTPTTGITATDIGQWRTHIRTQEIAVRALLNRNTNPWNLSGLPAVSIPCGIAPDGMPVGLQLTGAPFAEQKLLSVAEALEDTFGYEITAPDYRAP